MSDSVDRVLKKCLFLALSFRVGGLDIFSIYRELYNALHSGESKITDDVKPYYAVSVVPENNGRLTLDCELGIDSSFTNNAEYDLYYKMNSSDSIIRKIYDTSLLDKRYEELVFTLGILRIVDIVDAIQYIGSPEIFVRRIYEYNDCLDRYREYPSVSFENGMLRWFGSAILKACFTDEEVFNNSICEIEDVFLLDESSDFDNNEENSLQGAYLKRSLNYSDLSISADSVFRICNILSFKLGTYFYDCLDEENRFEIVDGFRSLLLKTDYDGIDLYDSLAVKESESPSIGDMVKEGLDECVVAELDRFCLRVE